MNLLLLCAIGLVCGLHAASWGGFKDSPFEGFKPVSFIRSVWLGVGSGVAVSVATDLDAARSMLVLVGLCYALERLATEWWKGIVREDDQRAYSIPMRLAVRGRPIDERGRRYAVGVIVVLGLFVTTLVARAVQHAVPPLPLWGVAPIAGIGGWLTAVGGAWKDAPVEGFSAWKFLRSPVVATAWATLLSRFTDDWVLLGLAAAGWSVISIETYKTFLTGGRPPGKFADKPVRFHPPVAREACRVVHVSSYGVLALAVWSRPPPAADLTPTDLSVEQLLASAAVGLAAVVAGALVLAGAPARPHPRRRVAGTVGASAPGGGRWVRTRS